jgi:ParB-like chromosome segregation protein Spo0J
VTESLPIAAIKIGPRHRRHPGDIEGLARSICDVGLLHPVVVGRDGTLIAGARRLLACKILGWTDVPVTIIDLESVVRGEYAENIERKDFTWSESVAIKREVEALEKPAAKERLREAGRLGGKGSGKLPEASKGRAGDKAAKATGRKRRTLEKAEAVIVAAEIDSKRFGDLAERIDEDNARVDVIHRELKQRQARASYEARIEKGSTVDDLQALAASGYRASVIYVDVPSRFETYSGKGKQRSPERHYNTMTIAELKAMGPLIRSLAAPNCALLYWTSGPHNKNALEVIEAWNFAYKTWAFVWSRQIHRAGC